MGNTKELKIMEVVQLKRHISPRKQKIRYIVIHDTGNPAPGAGATAHKKYFLTTDRKASADFLVEEDTIIKLNDYLKYFTWHCGDGRGKFGITNSNSLGIEMCINKGSNYQKTVNNTIKLTYKLMQELKIPTEQVIRHYDASRKRCPGSMEANNWDKWKRFKQSLIAYIDEQNAPDIVLIDYKGNKKFIETILKDDYNYVKIRDLAEILGKEVRYTKDQVTLLDK